MKIEDLVEGKRYRINRPTLESIQTSATCWVRGMNYLNGHVITYNKALIFEGNCSLLKVNMWQEVWSIDPEWLTLVEEEKDNKPSLEDSLMDQIYRDRDTIKSESQLPEVTTDTPMPEVKPCKDDKIKWTNDHYDFTYPLTKEDIDKGSIKLDPYFVSHQWDIGGKDSSGTLWHCFKTCARFGVKNDKEREIRALHAQVTRMAEIYGVDLTK